MLNLGAIHRRILGICFLTNIANVKIVILRSSRNKRGGGGTAQVTMIAVTWSNIDHALHAYAVADTLQNIRGSCQAAGECCILAEHG